MPNKGRQVVVVKSLRDLSPRKSVLVSRDPTLGETSRDNLEKSSFGNHSPTKPQRTKNGKSVLSRSILGKPETFDAIERSKSGRQSSSRSQSRSSTPQMDAGRTSAQGGMGDTSKMTLSSEMDLDSPRSEDSVDEESKAMTNEEYLMTLKRLQQHQLRVRSHDIEREANFTKYLPMSERLTLTKESKVLTLWQQRQREWQNVEQNISKRINSGDKHTLMMVKSDEYRARVEEYDLMQAAVPEKDKIGAQWELSLRGGGPRYVAVGHLFSGIECEVDSTPPIPKLVRKPRLPGEKPHRSGPMIEETEAILSRRKRFGKYLNDIRPHNMSFQQAENLLFKSKDLVQWAIDSSERKFADDIVGQVPAGDDSSLDEEHKSVVSVKVGSQAASKSDEASVMSLDMEGVPIIQVVDRPEATFSARREQINTRKFGFTNSGTVTISYVWKPLHPPNPVPSAATEDDLAGENATSRTFKSMDRSDKSREHLLSNERHAFYCARDRGVLLPGESVWTPFSFSTQGWAGVKNEEWILETTPKAKVFFPESCADMWPADEDEDDVVKRQKTPVHYTFHGHSTEHDEGHSSRAIVSNQLDAATVDSLAKDQIQLAFERLRSPVTVGILQERQRALFQRINGDILTSLSGTYAKSLPLYITPDRLRSFANTNSKAIVYCKSVSLTLKELRLRNENFDKNENPIASDNQLMKDLMPDFVGEEDVDEDADVKKSLRSEIFPEGTIEVFDTVTELDLAPAWAYDIQLIMGRLQKSLKDVDEIEMLEVVIAKKEAMRAKEVAREERREAARAARKAEREAERLAELEEEDEDEEENIDEDGNLIEKPPPADDEGEEEEEEDEEEEEEEEEDEEEDEDPFAKVKHALTIEGEAIVAECIGGVAELVIRPSPSADITRIAGEQLMNSLEAVPVMEEEARVAAGYPVPTEETPDVEPAAVEPIPSPFTSEEGAAAWATALAGEEGGDRNTLYKTAYESVREALYTATEEMFTGIDRHLELASRQDINESSANKEWEAAAVREADILNDKGQGFGNCVFMNFDGGVYTGLVRTGSAFDLAKSSQKKALACVLKVAGFGASAVVLVHEGDKGGASQTLNASVPAMQAILDEATAKIQKENQKLAKANRRLMKRVHKLGEEAVKAGTVMLFPDIKYEVISCSSVAALKAAMSQLGNKVTTIKPPTAVVGHVPKPRTMPVFVLEDLAIPGVIPDDPELPDLEEEDMECALAIGGDEFEEYRKRKWAEQRPHLVPVAVPDVEEPIEVYADVAASVQDAWEVAARVGDEVGFDVTWVDANLDALYAQDGTGLGGQHLQDLPFVSGKRLLSDEVREALLWTSVVRAQPVTHELIQDKRRAEAAAAASEADEDESEPRREGEVQETVADTPALSNVHSHVASLFPQALAGEEIKRVNALAVLGGNATPVKFRVIDDMINKFSTVMLVGEMALPFLGLMAHLKMPKYQELNQQLAKAAKALIGKARMRGVHIVLPVDAIVSEEKLPEDLAGSTVTKFDPEARDEGAEYEGDTATVSLMPAEPVNKDVAEGEKEVASSVQAGPTLVRGYIYDIGPETCTTLSAEIAAADLVFAWGVAGVCEVGPFQTGQRTMAEALNGNAPTPAPKGEVVGEGEDNAEAEAPEGESATAETASASKVTIVLGGATVEWCTRFLDSDGELQGDLIACGAVTYACRRAATVCGRLAAVSSPLYENGLKFRGPEESEWAYQGKVEPVEEEDE